MATPNLQSSGRRPHLWRIRTQGYRKLLLSKRWSMRGAYASKMIRGREVMVRSVEEHADHTLCLFQLKDDFWARIWADKRAREASQPPSSPADGYEDAAVSSVPVGLDCHVDEEWVRSNVWDLDSVGKILADRLLQREAAGLLMDRKLSARLAQEIERRIEQLHLAFPETEWIKPNLNYEPGTIAVDFHEDTIDRLLAGAHKNNDGDPRFKDPDLDAISERLGLWRAEFHGESVLALYFREYFSVKRAIAVLEELDGALKAWLTEWQLDDEPDLAGAPAGDGTFMVVVRGRYNERTFKYTSRGFHFFVVSNAEVTEVSAEDASRSLYFHAVVAERGWDRKLRWPMPPDS